MTSVTLQKKIFVAAQYECLNTSKCAVKNKI